MNKSDNNEIDEVVNILTHVWLDGNVDNSQMESVEKATQAIDQHYKKKYLALVPEEKDPRISDAFTNPDIVDGFNRAIVEMTNNIESQSTKQESK